MVTGKSAFDIKVDGLDNSEVIHNPLAVLKGGQYFFGLVGKISVAVVVASGMRKLLHVAEPDVASGTAA